MSALEHDTPITTPPTASRLAGPVLLSAAIAALLLAAPPLRGVTTQIGQLQGGWIAVAVALELASCAAFVVIFRLFFDPVPVGPARELAWAEQGSGALLPGGGVGALAVGAWLLRRAGMSKSSIIDRSSALFFLTSGVNVAALVGAGALLAAGGASGPYGLLRTAGPMLGGLIAAAAVLALPSLIARSPRRRWPAWVVDLSAGICRAQRSIRRPSWRLLGAAGYLGFDIAALGATFAATGHPLPLAPLVLGYLIGYLANLIPIPGGFGVLEGGLAGALIAYGAPARQAAAAVIVYHAIAFWIPSAGGLIGFALLRRRLVAPRAAEQLDGAPRASVDHGGDLQTLEVQDGSQHHDPAAAYGACRGHRSTRDGRYGGRCAPVGPVGGGPAGNCRLGDRGGGDRTVGDRGGGDPQAASRGDRDRLAEGGPARGGRAPLAGCLAAAHAGMTLPYAAPASASR
jgi:uncharacterized membrane protein YbhN (UPF0104 family)